MSEIEIPNKPAIKTGVKIDEVTKHQLLINIVEESQVILHCSYTGSVYADRIRIWKSTFLYARDSKHRSKLLHFENIALYPNWLSVKAGETVNFTLIFSGLPKHCKSFDMIERIPEPGGFEIKNIQRNQTDVYKIVIR